MPRRNLALFLLGALCLCGAPLRSERIRDIDRLISAEMTRQDIPGLSVAVASAEGPMWSSGYGLADLENFVPAKPYTVYRTASIAKPMTATAIMQLVEKGKIDLDAPVQKYVPDFPQKPWPITVRQLLGHLGGIRHYRDSDDANNTHHYATLRDALKIFEADDLIAEPGTRYNYSTYGFVLLGRILEGASGADYLDYMRANIFGPAQMSTMYADDTFAVIPNRTRGYVRWANGTVHNAPLLDTSSKIPGGGFVCSPEDLVGFALALGKGSLVSGASRKQMFTSQSTSDGKRTGYGLGWGINRVAGYDVVEHAGGQAGTSTLLTYFPEQKLAVAIMSNLQDARLNDLRDEIAKIVLSGW